MKRSEQTAGNASGMTDSNDSENISTSRSSKRNKKTVSYNDNGDEDDADRTSCNGVSKNMNEDDDDENNEEEDDDEPIQPKRQKNNQSRPLQRGLTKRDSGETSLEDLSNEDDDSAVDPEDEGVSSSSEAGQILLITVENFMCHRKLSVNFCRNVNFVTGQNGSGKLYSPILKPL